MGKRKTKDLKQLIEITKEEAVDCFINYNVEFDFCHYDGDVQTVYVREHLNSPNSVEFYMVENLQKRIQKINSRYRVGIMYTERIKEVEDFDQFR
tara:strand:- start:1063 stop:1347 length:285 start_codon:yes stop_codon:yes gene_type:complete